MTAAPEKTRLLVVCPTWLGDAVMATPALRLLRRALPGAFLGALCRPAALAALEGLDFLDELHPAPPGGIMAPKVAAQRIRTRRYAAALLLTNSFSTALSTRLAGVPLRLGYDRDSRGMLLTDPLPVPRRRDTPPFDRSPTAPNAPPPIPACDVYVALARTMLARLGAPAPEPPPPGPLELAVSPADERLAAAVLSRTGAADGEPFAVLIPGGNNPAKRWPPDRFAAVAAWLARERRLNVFINGAPAEADLCAAVASHAADALRGSIASAVTNLTPLGGTIGSLKALLRRAHLLITNDTGPRHVAAALGTPVVTLFGPTDPRWTTITPYLPPRRDGRTLPMEIELAADPTLPPEEVADDHPDRCRIDRIESKAVIAAVERLLG